MGRLKLLPTCSINGSHTGIKVDESTANECREAAMTAMQFCESVQKETSAY